MSAGMMTVCRLAAAQSLRAFRFQVVERQARQASNVASGPGNLASGLRKPRGYSLEDCTTSYVYFDFNGT